MASRSRHSGAYNIKGEESEQSKARRKEKRKAEETYEKESMLGKISEERKRRQRNIDKALKE